MKNNTELTDKLLDLAIKHFHKWYGLLAAIAFEFVTALPFYKLLPTDKIYFEYYLIFVASIAFLTLLFWFYYIFYLPKRSKKKLGVSVAIKVESMEDQKFLNNDFILPFKKKIQELKLPFDVLIPNKHFIDAVETLADAENLLRKTRSHFCIWGEIKKRKNSKLENDYIFSLNGIVVHQPITQVQKIILGQEFDAFLPNTLTFEEGLQFKLFEFRANQAILALDYITGRAALLSGDFNIAISLHEALLQLLERSNQSAPISRDVVKKLLSLEYDLKASSISPLSLNLDLYAETVQKSLQYDPQNYGALLRKAIVEFNNGFGSAKTALNTIRRAKKCIHLGNDWLYSMCFLNFWLGNYPDALLCCEKIQQKSYVGEEITVKGVVFFTEFILQKHYKPQLYFWIGFVSFVKDKNLPFADTCFQKFLDNSDESTKMLEDRARAYLAIIKKEIGYL